MGVYSGGSGTAGYPYLISNSSDWEELVVTSADWGDNFLVTNDIDFEDSNPSSKTIGKITGAIFTGTFDGGGYTFSNAIIEDTPDAQNGMALFVRVGPATIKNLILNNFIIAGTTPNIGSGYCGALVAESGIRSLIENCHLINCYVSMIYTEVSEPIYCGAMIGANHGSVNNCFVSGGSVDYVKFQQTFEEKEQERKKMEFDIVLD